MQLSPMGDNYSPPEDASQNQNYQQLVFAIPRRISFCLHIRLRKPTQAGAFFDNEK